MESNNQYLSRRAVEEEDAADRSSDPKVRDVHAELAARYRNAAERDSPLDKKDAERRSALLSTDFRILE